MTAEEITRLEKAIEDMEYFREYDMPYETDRERLRLVLEAARAYLLVVNE